MPEPIVVEAPQTFESIVQKNLDANKDKPAAETTTPAETTASQTITETTTPETQPESAGNILTRVSKKKETPKTPEDTAGTFKMFDDITDPVQREKLIAREKERTADYTRKMQDVSRQREEVEKFKKDSQNWSPERIQRELLNNPQFVEAARQVASVQNPAGSTLTDEQFSALTPAEKSQMQEMTRQLGELRQQTFIAAAREKDTSLQSQYEDYDALKVNQAFRDLAVMNPIDLKEHIYRSIYHDEHVDRAYNLGLEEGKGINKERIQAVGIEGIQVQPSGEKYTKLKGENSSALLQRIIMTNIAKAKGLQAATKR